MQLASFQVTCDLEIGDKVKYLQKVYEIRDIRTTHYLRTVEVIFEFELCRGQEILEGWHERVELYGPLNVPGVTPR